MEMLFGGMSEKNQLVPYGDNLTIDGRPGLVSPSAVSEQAEAPSIDVRRLLAKYWLLLMIMILGAAGGSSLWS
jgi:hypothetical protein